MNRLSSSLSLSSPYKHRSLLPTLLTIGLSVFLVSGIVVAATTIGSSLSTDGNLTVLGNVGIGTSTPSARFSFTGDGTGATRAFVFANASNVEKVTILNNGNLGVGTTSPFALLSLNAPAGQASFAIGSSTATSFIVNAAGNVGVRTANPATAFSVVGNTSNLTDASFPPTLVSTISGGNNWNNLDVSGNYVYVAEQSGGNIRIYDISNITSPVLVKTLNVGETRMLFVAGKYLYLCSRGFALRIYDISNPTTPILTGSVGISGSWPQSIFVSGSYAYLAVTNDTLQIVNVANPSKPVLVSNTSGVTYNPLYVVGKYFYGKSSGGNLIIYDVSNPATPVLATTTSLGLSSRHIQVSGRYLYGGSGNNFVVYDTADPTSPLQVSSTAMGATVQGVHVAGRYAYIVTSSNATLSVYDVINPASPVLITSTVLTGSTVPTPQQVVVRGRYAFINGWGFPDPVAGLYIYDISGLETTAAMIHSLSTGNLDVSTNARINGYLQVRSGLNVGAEGLLSAGDMAAGQNLYVTNFLGLATSSPYAMLSVASANAATTTLALAPISGQTANVLDIYSTAGALRSVYTAAGLLGIGTTSPAKLLSIQGSALITGPLSLEGTLTATSSALLATNGGSVGIGATSSPASLLSILQSANTKAGGLALAATDGDTRSLYMNTSGVLSFEGGDGGTTNIASLNAAGAWTNASDQSYKEHIQDLPYGLPEILKLKPRSYQMKGSHLQQIGFIAQEVKPLIPEVVDGEEGSLGISYGNLVSLTVRGIQELNAKIESLGAAIKDGVLTVKEMISENVKAKHVELEDEDTGALYCVRVKSGVLINTQGACPGPTPGQ